MMNLILIVLLLASPCFSGQVRDVEGDDDDFISVADDSSLQPTLTMSVMAWIKMESTGDNVFVAKRDTNPGSVYVWELARRNSTNRMTFRIGANTNNCEGTSDFDDTANWIHIAGTYQKSVATTCYRDAVQEDQTSHAITLLTDTVALTVGRRQHDGALGSYDGLVGDVRFYDIELSQNEITTARNGGLNAIRQGLQMQLVLFEGGTDPVFFDQSINSNDGTNNGTVDGDGGPNMYIAGGPM